MMPVFRPHSSANIERMEFAKKLINLMRDKNLNQSDLARKSGLTRDAISTYVRARSMPEPLNLAKLAKALGVEPSYFQLDYYRIAERMASPEPFNADPLAPATPATVATVATAEPSDPVSMTINSDGMAVVKINAVMEVAKAAELLAFFKKG